MIQDIQIIAIKIVVITIILIIQKNLYALMKKNVLQLLINLLKKNLNALIIVQMMIFLYINLKIIAIKTARIIVISD